MSAAPPTLHDALVLLASNSSERARFLASPGDWLRSAGLAAAEQEALRALPGQALVRYAESLLDKRIDELARAIPCTVRAFPQILQLYRAWLARHPAPTADDALTPGLREALRAGPALAEQIEPEWLAELFLYEVLSGCSRRDGRPRKLAARWPQHRLLDELSRGEIPLDPDEEPRLYTFPARPAAERS